jgi:hypothetical protein
VAPDRDPEGGLVPNSGLRCCQSPRPATSFFDIEGDPFFGSEEVDGIDYLLGVIEPGHADAKNQQSFHSFWAIARGTVTTVGERRAFEAFIDLS